MPAVVIAAVLALLGLTLPATPAHAMQRVPGAVPAVTVESEPSYGPDGPSFDRETISTIDSRTGRIRALASGYGPRFSPGGRWIAFCRGGLWVMRSDGRQAVRLTQEFCQSLTWAPDGRAIAYSDGHDIYRVARRRGPVLRIGAADEAGVMHPPARTSSMQAATPNARFGETAWSHRGRRAT
jgi:WD40 repeat protein